MTFAQSVNICLFEYASFDGRATRSEFWWFVLAVTLALVAAGLLDYFYVGRPLIVYIVLLLVALPLVAVGARRLHDTDRSGWWQLLFLFPLLGAIMIIINYAMPSTGLTNEHGPPQSR